MKNNRGVNSFILFAATAAVALTACSDLYTPEPEETPAPPKPTLLGKWGSTGTGDGQFDWPAGIAVAANGNVYVVDAQNYRVQYFAADGSFLGKWGSKGTGEGQFENPASVAISPDGTVYVSDAATQRIQYFTPTGSFLGAWDAGFYNPSGLEFSAKNDSVYVVPYEGFRIYYFTSAGSLRGSWSPRKMGSWDSVSGIGCHPDGTVYVSVSTPDYNRVEAFTEAGSFKRAYDRGLATSSPSDVAASPRGGRVYVVAKSGTENKIVRYDASAGFVTEWGGDIGSRDGEFDDPYGVAVGPDGTIYVADSRNNRIQYFVFKE